MQTMMQDGLVEKILEWNFSSFERKQGFLSDQKKLWKTKIVDAQNYLSFETSNNTLKKLVFAEFSDTAFEFDRIKVGCFYFSQEKLNRKYVLEELIALRKFFLPRKLNISVNVPMGAKKTYLILHKLKFQQTGTMLVGDVKHSYEKALKFKLGDFEKEFQFRYFNFSRDSKNILLLGYKAHKNEPTSIFYKLPQKEHASFLKSYLKTISQDKTGLILMHKGKDIGFVSYFVRQDCFSSGHIASISLDPKYKGQGLSRLMYKKILDLLHKRKLKQFFGYTNTKQVLKLSNELQRYPCFNSLRFNKELSLKN